MSSLERMRAAGWNDEIMGFVSALDADGYDMALDRAGDGSVKVEVSARPDACEDCLVPKEVMATILAKACETEVERIDLRYPVDVAGA